MNHLESLLKRDSWAPPPDSDWVELDEGQGCASLTGSSLVGLLLLSFTAGQHALWPGEQCPVDFLQTRSRANKLLCCKHLGLPGALGAYVASISLGSKYWDQLLIYRWTK